MTSALVLLLSLVAATEDHDESARTLIVLAEQRPLFLRLRVTTADQPFDVAWMDSIRLLHQALDRDSDGKLTPKEADAAALAGLVRLATGETIALNPSEIDSAPSDGTITVDELAAALRSSLGSFRLQTGRRSVGRTDALFDQLDLDKDGQLTRPELAAISGSLRPLDLDDNEMISVDELEPFNDPTLMATAALSMMRQARYTALPPVVELVAGESSLRPARLLLKKYDKGNGDVSSRPDGKLSLSEFAIDPDTFARADRNHDESLDTDELRRWLVQPPIDLELLVSFPAGSTAPATAKVGDRLPQGVTVRKRDEGDLEVAVAQIRLDALVEDSAGAAAAVRRTLTQRFKALDANKDGYLSDKEKAALGAGTSPLAGLVDMIDHDGDGKLYLQEMLDFGDRQLKAARCRLVVTTDDLGRALFGILDLDSDRRLGAREVMRTLERVQSWDTDGDGRISADEIPYHLQVTIARGTLTGLIGDAMPRVARSRRAPAREAAASPAWFPLMDRNHDGDVSHREFLGPREQFDRLDRDHDGLIDVDEARAAELKEGCAVVLGRHAGVAWLSGSISLRRFQSSSLISWWRIRGSPVAKS
jgi:Ca2+-binding EF-hand superfamily protein